MDLIETVPAGFDSNQRYNSFTCLPNDPMFNIWLKKKLLYKENQNLGKAMQQPMDSYVSDINTSSKSYLILSCLLFAR